MKKRVLSFALVLALALAFVPSALAAPQPFTPWVIEWLEATLMTENKTAHDYLGNIKIGDLYFWNGDPCEWTFSVYIVDDSVTTFVKETYIGEKAFDFTSYAYNSANSAFFYDWDLDAAITETAYDHGNNFVLGTKDDPFVTTFYRQDGFWFPQRFTHYIYDGSINAEMDEITLEENYLGWFGYGVIILTKSQLAQYHTTGKLPKMSSSVDGDDLSSYVDLTELYALLDANKVQKIKPTPSTVYFDGKAVAFEAYNINGFNHFKLRDLAYVLSGTGKQIEVGFDDATKTVTITTGKPYTPAGIELAQGDGLEKSVAPTKMAILLDGEQIDLTVYLINGNNFFKLRDLMELLDVFVDYDETTKNVIVDSTKGYVDN